MLLQFSPVMREVMREVLIKGPGEITTALIIKGVDTIIVYCTTIILEDRAGNLRRRQAIQAQRAGAGVQRQPYRIPGMEPLHQAVPTFFVPSESSTAIAMQLTLGLRFRSRVLLVTQGLVYRQHPDHSVRHGDDERCRSGKESTALALGDVRGASEIPYLAALPDRNHVEGAGGHGASYEKPGGADADDLGIYERAEELEHCLVWEY
ncbi:hypothetical protein DFH06DRAFT_1123557 [Mycena polygramma]|nr:hypothetical protein DFH06DRAFT_1123557 [Mycena polygramma]